MTKTSPSDIDVHIGTQLKLKRLKTGKTMQEIALVLNVSFQQVQKYEKGVNKISGSGLYVLAHYLDVEIGYFFGGLKLKNKGNAFELKQNTENFMNIAHLNESELGELIRSYSKIKEKLLRKKVVDLVKNMA